MKESPQELRQILDAADLLLRDVIADLDRAVNTRTQEWSIETRQRAMEALSLKAGKTAEIFGNWMHQNVSIKNIAKICGRLDSLRYQAHLIHFEKSRNWGRAHLREYLQPLIELLGNGCEFEPEIPVPEIHQSPEVIQHTVPPANTKSLVDPCERPYSIQDLMVLHNLSHHSVVSIYQKEPGVLIFQGPRERQRKGGRIYRTIRVPRHVYLRVRRRLENK